MELAASSWQAPRGKGNKELQESLQADITGLASLFCIPAMSTESLMHLGLAVVAVQHASC